jgi:hypothetical protein
MCFYPIAILVPLIFHFLEQQQEELSKALSRRAVNLEYLIDRLSFDRCESERKKTTRDRDALEKVIGTPRIGVTLSNIARQKIYHIVRNMLPLKTNIFYYFQYTVFVLALTISIIFKSPINSNKVEQLKESSIMETKRTVDTGLEGIRMQKQDEFNSLEEELYSLLGRIEHGDISEIDTYWSSLADGLRELKFEDWKKPDGGSSVSEILESMSFIPRNKKLIKVASDMESLCSRASTDSMEEKELDELQSLAMEFEELFLQYIEELKHHKEKMDD